MKTVTVGTPTSVMHTGRNLACRFIRTIGVGVTPMLIATAGENMKDAAIGVAASGLASDEERGG
jgi:hypothetical protein